MNETTTAFLRTGKREYAKPFVTLTLVCSVLDLSKEDRDFVFGLADQIRAYERRNAAEQADGDRKFDLSTPDVGPEIVADVDSSGDVPF